jgi:hypothetical protein
MIGGTDIVIATGASTGNALVACLRVIRRIWPNAVIEDASTDEKVQLGRGVLLPDDLPEVFVYPDMETATKWDELGAEPELANTMIHILVRSGQVTLVVDDPKAEPVARIVARIGNALRMDVFPIARGEAA